ncbi:MAG: Lrp/AsnC family transcriptional regulator [Rhodospirillales bacterium]|nr:Lrp/AsnC family transcriptional regulator [Rhodospirillales bacterium]
MDRENRALLALIQRDGRMPYAQLARQVGLSAAAVHDRLKKLKAGGALRYWSAVADPARLGYPLLAFVRVQTDLPGNARALADTLALLPDVLECHLVNGAWNCLIKVRASGPAGLDALVSERIAPCPGILRLQTEVVSLSTKESHIVPTGDSSAVGHAAD